MSRTLYSDGYYKDKPEEKEAYEEAVVDIWWIFRRIRDGVENDFFLGRRSLNNSVTTRSEMQNAMNLIEQEYPEIFKDEEEEQE